MLNIFLANDNPKSTHKICLFLSPTDSKTCFSHLEINTASGSSQSQYFPSIVISLFFRPQFFSYFVHGLYHVFTISHFGNFFFFKVSITVPNNHSLECRNN